MSILYQATSRFNVTPFKIQMVFFTEMGKNSKICMEPQKTSKGKSSLEK